MGKSKPIIILIYSGLLPNNGSSGSSGNLYYIWNPLSNAKNYLPNTTTCTLAHWRSYTGSGKGEIDVGDVEKEDFCTSIKIIAVKRGTVTKLLSEWDVETYVVDVLTLWVHSARTGVELKQIVIN